MSIHLKCPKPDCGHEWDYTGKCKPGQYACCPKCLRRVRIPDGKPGEKNGK